MRKFKIQGWPVRVVDPMYVELETAPGESLLDLAGEAVVDAVMKYGDEAIGHPESSGMDGCVFKIWVKEVK